MIHRYKNWSGHSLVEAKEGGMPDTAKGLVGYFVSCAVFAFWTQRCLGIVLSDIKDTEIDVPYVWSFLVTLLLPAALIFNVGAEIWNAVT